VAKIDQLIVGETYRYATYTGYGIRTDRGSFGRFVAATEVSGPLRGRSWTSERRTVRHATFEPLGAFGRNGSIVSPYHEGLQHRSADGFDVAPFDVDEYREQRRQTRQRFADERARRIAEVRELVPALRVLAAATGDPARSRLAPFLYRDHPRTDLTLRTDNEIAEHLVDISTSQRSVDLLTVLRAAAAAIS
jgi:hypothetical protein